MLLNVLQCTGHPPAEGNPAPTVSTAEAEKPGLGRIYSPEHGLQTGNTGIPLKLVIKVESHIPPRRAESESAF